jgi:hypothetical protein
MEFEKWYKKTIESNTEDPPGKVWEEVQNSLDIDQVWDKVNIELKPATTRNKKVIMAMAASFLLLIALLGTIWFQTNLFRTPQTADALFLPEAATFQQLTAITGKQTALSINNQASTILIQHGSRPSFLKNPDDSQFSRDEAVASIIETRNLHPLPSQIEGSSPSDYAVAPISQSAKTIFDRPATAYADDIVDPIKNDLTIHRHGRYFGLSLQYANTWLRNEKTAAGLQNTSLVDTRPSFGKSFGLYYGQKVSESLDLKLALDMISEKSQTYNEYVHGHFVSTGIDMNYTKLAFTAAYRFSTGSPQRAIGGVYAAYLTDASYFIGEAGESVLHDYNKADYGLIAGYEYMHSLGQNLQIGTGLYANYGLRNVFSGNEQLPAYLNRTNLLSLHLGISVGYAFR